jgi:hypothetical protein
MGNSLDGRYPAVVDSYDADQRLCRVSIPGITTGADVLPLAEIEYPVGDKASHDEYATEIEMLAGSLVWVAFIAGDARYPIITGGRNPRTGNGTKWRRYHHANIDLVADDVARVTADKIHVGTKNDNALALLADALGQLSTALQAAASATVICASPGSSSSVPTNAADFILVKASIDQIKATLDGMTL